MVAALRIRSDDCRRLIAVESISRAGHLNLCADRLVIVDGALVIVLAIAHRRELTGKWEWMMFNGVIDLILAGNPRLSRHARMGVCILRHFKACQQLDIAGCTVNGCFPGAVGLGRGPESRPFRLNLIASLSLVPGAPLD